MIPAIGTPAYEAWRASAPPAPKKPTVRPARRLPETPPVHTPTTAPIHLDAPTRVKAVVRAVCIAHDLMPADVFGRRRFGHLVRARQEVMWRLRQDTTLSLPTIGRYLGGYDHTTILCGERRHQARIEESVTIVAIALAVAFGLGSPPGRSALDVPAAPRLDGEAGR